MGLLSNILGRLKHSGTRADNSVEHNMYTPSVATAGIVNPRQSRGVAGSSPATGQPITYFSLRKLMPYEQAEDGECWLHIDIPGDYAIRQEMFNGLVPTDSDTSKGSSKKPKGGSHE